MARHDTDILISGGGVAGLTAACAFGTAGFRVLCVDPSMPITSETAEGADQRTTAFLQPAQRLLAQAGLWERLAPHAASLQIMRIVEAASKGKASDIADFNAADISDSPFGWNLPNWLLRREMLARIDELPNVTFQSDCATTRLTQRSSQAIVTLSDGNSWRARLVLAADGRNSMLRSACNIGVKTWRYGQKALSFTVTHPVPHQNVSTEIHRSGGPFTFVPMPDLDGQPRSAIVWMEKGAAAKALMALDRAAFEAAILERSDGLFGPLTLAGPRSLWPIISQLAECFISQRVALIAEAAHVVPPIGAQGLNMSLADTACLLELATSRPDDLGSAQMLERYQKSRWGEVKARVLGIDMLNRSSIVENPALQDLRRMGLKALHNVTPVRRALMKAGLGAT